MMPTPEERILTLHPQGKKGINILKRRYELVKDTLLHLLEAQGEITYQELNSLAKEALADTLDGSIPWYVVSVKLDLEARGVIRRIPGTSPHKLTLPKAGP